MREEKEKLEASHSEFAHLDNERLRFSCLYTAFYETFQHVIKLICPIDERLPFVEKPCSNGVVIMRHYGA